MDPNLDNDAPNPANRRKRQEENPKKKPPDRFRNSPAQEQANLYIANMLICLRSGLAAVLFSSLA